MDSLGFSKDSLIFFGVLSNFIGSSMYSLGFFRMLCYLMGFLRDSSGFFGFFFWLPNGFMMDYLGFFGISRDSQESVKRIPETSVCGCCQFWLEDVTSAGRSRCHVLMFICISSMWRITGGDLLCVRPCEWKTSFQLCRLELRALAWHSLHFNELNDGIHSLIRCLLFRAIFVNNWLLIMLFIYSWKIWIQLAFGIL